MQVRSSPLALTGGLPGGESWTEMRIVDELTANELGGMKDAKRTDLLEYYNRGYCADGYGDVDGRPWHFRISEVEGVCDNE